MNLTVKRGHVIVPEAIASVRGVVIKQLRDGTYAGTVAGNKVIGLDGVAALLGVTTQSLHQARWRRNQTGSRSPRHLPDPHYQVEYRGAPVYLYRLDDIRTWAVQTGRIPAT